MRSETGVKPACAGRSVGHLSPSRTSLLVLAVLFPLVAAADQDTLDDRLATAAEAQRAGRREEALAILQAALTDVGASPSDRAALLASLGGAQLLAGDPAAAEAVLRQALDSARLAGRRDLEAVAWHNLGDTLATRPDVPHEAFAAYDAAADLAKQTGRADIVVRARIRAADLAVEDDPDLAGQYLDEAWSQAAVAESSSDAVFDLLSLARLSFRLGGDQMDATRLLETLLRAERDAATLGDTRALSFARGYLGQLYERENRTDEALRLYRQATGLAEEANAPDSLHHWLAGSGHLLLARGERPRAVEAFRGAVDTLTQLRGRLLAFDPATGRSTFRATTEPVFLAYVGLILEDARAASGAARQDLLKEARRRVETLKKVELEDYFRDPCVAELERRTRSVDAPGPSTAALYPIPLVDRLELLLTLPDGTIHQAVQPVPRAELERTVREARAALEDPSADPSAWRVSTKRLHDWLLRPLLSPMAATGVETLVVVPDGALRTIPFAALHDGERFAIERFAFGTTPGLDLLETDGGRVGRVDDLLLGGVSQGVANLTPLPNVRRELDRIQLAHGGVLLLDQGFTRTAFERRFKATPFRVVHIASHGRFQDEVSRSFVQAYDGRIGLDELERLIKGSRFRDQPVDLLALSACETARGNDRAALGLAGIAVKSGARAALASLWLADDATTGELMTAFYDELARPGTDKAQALRRAQLRLLARNPDLPPFVWAPFLIIGNWR